MFAVCPTWGEWSNPIWWACVLNRQLGVSYAFIFDWWVGLFKNMIQEFSMVLKNESLKSSSKIFHLNNCYCYSCFFAESASRGIRYGNPELKSTCFVLLWLLLAFFSVLFGVDSRPFFFWGGGGFPGSLFVFKGSPLGSLGPGLWGFVGNLEALIMPVLVGKDLILEGFAVEKRGQTSSRCIQWKKFSYNI